MVMNELLQEMRVMPKIVQNGVKIYKLTVPRTKTSPLSTFLDTFNFIPVALDKLPKTMDVNVLAKMFFPHDFNIEENYNRTDGRRPKKEDYGYHKFKKEKLKAFKEWWHEHKNDAFNLGEKLLEYCQNDVEILVHSVSFDRVCVDNFLGFSIPRNFP